MRSISSHRTVNCLPVTGQDTVYCVLCIVSIAIIVLCSCASLLLHLSSFPLSPPTNCLPTVYQLPFPATQPFFACLTAFFLFPPPSLLPIITSARWRESHFVKSPRLRSMIDHRSVRTDHVRRERETSPKPQKCMKQVPSSWPLLLRS